MPILHEYYNSGDDADANTYGASWRAQTFTTTISYTITSVKLLLYKNGDPGPGTVTVSIRATDGDGHPTGADLCSGSTDGNNLPTGSPYEWREIFFGIGYKLSASTKYAIVIRAPTGTFTRNLVWRVDSSAASYSGGNDEVSINAGSTWTAVAGYDFMFENWYKNPNPLTMQCRNKLIRRSNFKRALVI